MKKGSLIRQLAIMLTAQILLLIVVLLLVIAYTIHNARVEKEKMLSNPSDRVRAESGKQDPAGGRHSGKHYAEPEYRVGSDHQ